jgi:hypothetical protein
MTIPRRHGLHQLPGSNIMAWIAAGRRNDRGDQSAHLRRALQSPRENALRTPEETQRFADRGLDLVGSTPDELAAHLRREVQKWGPMIKERGMKAE